MLALAALAAGAPAAHAKSYALPAASYTLEVEPSGAARVTERITFAFDGSFSGAFRDVPLPAGARMRSLSVSEGARRYRRSGKARIHAPGRPGTFAAAIVSGHGARIVWHYVAHGGRRTFTLRYVLTGVLVAHDDVVDVHPQVWGNTWPVALGRLRVVIRLPRAVRPGEDGAFRVWGHPYTVHGWTRRAGDRALATLSALPAAHGADVRVLLPRAMLTPAAPDARRSPGLALDRIVRAEQGAFASYTTDRRRVRHLAAHPLTALPYVLLAIVAPALLIPLALFLLFGRERRTGYDQRYEREPPDDLPPALVPGLLSQRPAAGRREFVATMFDLIQRGYYTATPNGGSDDALIARAGGDRAALHSYEAHVDEVLNDLVAEGPVPLSEFPARAAEVDTIPADYRRFRAKADAALETPEFFDATGHDVRRVLRVALLVAAAVLLYTAFHGYDAAPDRWARLHRGGLGIGALLTAVVLYALPRATFVRRTREAQARAERWAAFRRYLHDFPRLEQAPAISLALWERLLVFGIALGLATELLDGARRYLDVHALQETALYGSAVVAGGGVGGGDGWGSDFGHVLTSAPAGSWAGGGGGFGGGGGGGFGGGGGGAW